MVLRSGFSFVLLTCSRKETRVSYAIRLDVFSSLARSRLAEFEINLENFFHGWFETVFGYDVTRIVYFIKNIKSSNGII